LPQGFGVLCTDTGRAKRISVIHQTMNSYRFLSGASVLAFSALVLSPQANAADAPAPDAAASAPAPTPFVAATTNVNLVSDYRFRGIDQTWGKPAVQGGADLTLANGIYAGVWASNVSGNSYPGGSLEMDLYAGYNGKINDDFGYTVGGYGYVYPGANFNKSACPSAAYPVPCTLPSRNLNTFELNAGVTWKWISYKLSVSTGDYFGANASTGYSGHSSGTLYHDLSATWAITDDISLVAHVGHTDVKATYAGGNPDYTDYRVTLSKTFTGGWSVSAAGAGANNNRFYRPPVGGLSYGNGDTRNVNKPVLILQVGRTF
jgi:uncharacterized protein (TIGR02001 family)